MSSGVEGVIVETGIEVAARFAVATLSELLSRANEQERQTIERHIASIKGRPARDLGPAIDASAKAAMERVTGRAPVVTSFGTQRRQNIDLLTPAEMAIRNAVAAVEAAGASVSLTNAVVLLQHARAAVADHVEADGATTPAQRLDPKAP